MALSGQDNEVLRVAWIELHQSVWTHRKTLLLADALGLIPIYAAAHISHLWTWALDNAPNGELTGLPPRVIAAGAGWTGDPEQFIAAVITSGYVERADEALLLHDWDDYAGRLIDRREQQKERMRAARSQRKPASRKGKTPTKPRAHNVSSTCDERAQLPYPTVPNQTEPNEEDNTAAVEAGACEAKVDQAQAASVSAKAECTALINSQFASWPLAGTPYEVLLQDADRLGWPVLLEAVRRTAGAGKSDIRFCLGITKRWLEAGIDSLEALEIADKRWAAEKERPPRSGSVRDRTRTGPGRRSNVLLDRPAKPEGYYDHVLQRFDADKARPGGDTS
jgi:hypothetical protein